MAAKDHAVLHSTATVCLYGPYAIRDGARPYPRALDGALPPRTLNRSLDGGVHLQNMRFDHKGLGVRNTPLPLVPCPRQAARLCGHMWSAHESDVGGGRP